MIDVNSAREAHNDGIIDDIVWIRREFNMAVEMTKATILPQLVEMREEGKLKYELT